MPGFTYEYVLEDTPDSQNQESVVEEIIAQMNDDQLRAKWEAEKQELQHKFDDNTILFKELERLTRLTNILSYKTNEPNNQALLRDVGRSFRLEGWSSAKLASILHAPNNELEATELLSNLERDFGVAVQYQNQSNVEALKKSLATNLTQIFQKECDQYQIIHMNQSQGLLRENITDPAMLKPKCDLLVYKRLPSGKLPRPERHQIYFEKNKKNPKQLDYLYLNPDDKNQVLRRTLNINIKENERKRGGRSGGSE